MDGIIHTTGKASLAVQIITTAIDTYVLSLDTDPKKKDYKILLTIENIVNYVEGFFYIWMVCSFTSIKNITKYRYYDWIITTPTMLFTYSMFVLINQKMANNEPHDLFTIVLEEKFTLASIMIFNWLMLWFGYMSETGKIGTVLAVCLGFVPFVAMFYIIYEKYAKHTSVGQTTFYYFVAVWALYGFAALTSYKVKNVLYNILDLFAKNFFGLFLAYMVVFS